MTGRRLVVFAVISIGSVTLTGDAYATTGGRPPDCVHEFSEAPTQGQYYGMAQDLAVNECTRYCYTDEWGSSWSSGDVCGWEVIDLFLFDHPIIEQLVYILIEEIVDLVYPYL
jgi:hypothetical protein